MASAAVCPKPMLLLWMIHLRYVFGPCFAMYMYLINFAIILLRKRDMVAYLNCGLADVWTPIFCGSSSWCSGLACGMWYFLVMLAFL